MQKAARQVAHGITTGTVGVDDGRKVSDTKLTSDLDLHDSDLKMIEGLLDVPVSGVDGGSAGGASGSGGGDSSSMPPPTSRGAFASGGSTRSENFSLSGLLDGEDGDDNFASFLDATLDINVDEVEGDPNKPVQHV